MLVNKRITVTITVLGVLSLVLGGGLSIPMVMSISGLREKIAKENAEIENRYIVRRQTSDALTTLDDVKKQLAELDGGDLKEGKELDFINALEKAASTAGVDEKISLETVNQRDISPWEKEVPVKLIATGKFNDILSFMDKVERLSYLIVVKRVEVSIPQQREMVAFGAVTVAIDALARWHSDDLPVLKKLDVNAVSDETSDAAVETPSAAKTAGDE